MIRRQTLNSPKTEFSVFRHSSFDGKGAEDFWDFGDNSEISQVVLITSEISTY